MSEVIEPFSGAEPTCKKCRKKHYIGSIDKYDLASDTLSRTCLGCGYKWYERPADR